ncbi:MAG: type II secretion system F family protein [Candidatus Doudnabacteria bacterium]|nr:type II secretion system F family protein [Candidatus Doudnabacteria bacterium]
MKFLYKAKNKAGEIKAGTVMASDQSRAEQLMAENNLIIISLEQQEESYLTKLNPFGKSVNHKDLVLFSRQLSTLISARVPILQSLRILEDQISRGFLLAILRDLINSIENGESLSLALSKHPNVFGDVYVSLVKSGEVSGSLDRSFAYLADQLEKDYELRAKVKTALTYPTFVVAALGIVGVLMFKFVLPKLTAVLEEQGGELPAVSKGLITFTKFFDQFWWLVLLIIGVMIIALRYSISTTAGRRRWDRLKIQLPIVGDIFQKIYLARFSRNLSTLVMGGIPIIKAMQIVGDVINNSLYKEIVNDGVNKISSGKSISESLSGHSEFPTIVIQMIRVGEQTAQLDEILGKMATFYEKEVDNKVSTLTTLLEPLIMIILGIGVGLLVAGILLPIYNLASTAS